MSTWKRSYLKRAVPRQSALGFSHKGLTKSTSSKLLPRKPRYGRAQLTKTKINEVERRRNEDPNTIVHMGAENFVGLHEDYDGKYQKKSLGRFATYI